MPRVVRKQKPPVPTDYRKYKPYLRLDFGSRCAYCHIPEVRYGSPGNYSVDHFRPKSRPEFQRFRCLYANLFYACMDCNRIKGNTWPTRQLQNLGFRFLNPCRDNMANHWTVDETGLMIPKTLPAEYMIARLNLNRRLLCEWRRDKSDLAARIQDLSQSIALTGNDRDLKNALTRVLNRLSKQLLEEFADYWR